MRTLFSLNACREQPTSSHPPKIIGNTNLVIAICAKRMHSFARISRWWNRYRGSNSTDWLGTRFSSVEFGPIAWLCRHRRDRSSSSSWLPVGSCDYLEPLVGLSDHISGSRPRPIIHRLQMVISLAYILLVATLAPLFRANSCIRPKQRSWTEKQTSANCHCRQL